MFKKYVLILSILLLGILNASYAQTPDATGNFVKPEIEISTTPEFPGICDVQVGTSIVCNEDFLTYEWESIDFPMEPHLYTKSVTLTKIGNWKLSVSKVVDKVTCFRDLEFEVFDLKNSQGIKDYLLNAGFYSIPIERGNITNSSECEVDLIKFPNSGTDLTSINSFFDIVINDFRPIKGLNSTTVITDNECFCSNGTLNVEALETQFKQTDVGLWGHAFFNGRTDLNGELFIKGRMPFENSLPIENQKEHFDELFPNILATSKSSLEKGRILTSNMFMPHPLGGYDYIGECSPQVPNFQNIYLSPTSSPIFLPEASNNHYFFNSENQDNVFKGALAKFDLDNNTYLGFRFYDNLFSGYFDEISATIFEDFETPDFEDFDVLIPVVLPVVCNDECVEFRPNMELENLLTNQLAGFHLPIKSKPQNIYENCEGTYLPQHFENSDNESVSFIAPSGGIITLPHDEISHLFFSFGAITSEGEFESNISTGLLLSFKLLDQYGINIEYTYDFDDKKYKSALGDYQDNYDLSVVDGVIFQLACGSKFTIYKVEKGNLLKHVNGQGQSLYNNFKLLIEQILPFASDFAYMDGPLEANNVYSCAWCPGEISALITAGRCQTPEHIILDKIAQVATLFEDYFKEFTQEHNWEIPIERKYIDATGKVFIYPPTDWEWGQYLDLHQETKDLYGVDNVAFFKIFLDQFLLFIETKGDFWEDLDTNTPKVEVINHLKSEPQFITKYKPSYAKIELALSTLFEDNEIFEPTELSIIHLLGSCFDKSAEVLSYLENLQVDGATESGLQYLWTNFNDAFGEDNLTALFTVIASHIAERNEEMEYNNKQYLEYFLDNPNEVPKLEADILKWVNADAEFTGSNTIKVNDLSPLPYDNILPFEVVGTFSIGGQVYKKGAILNLTTAQAKLYSYTNDITVAENSALAALDLGLMVMGIGAAKVLFTAGNWVQKSIIIGDLIGSTTGIAVTLLNADVISRELRTKLQIGSLLASVPMIVTAFPKVKTIVDDLDGVIRNVNPPPTTVLNAAEEAADDLLKKIISQEGEISSDFSDEILAIADDIGAPSCKTACKLSRYGCFEPQTLVSTEKGELMISDIRPDDKVWTFNEATKSKELKSVLNVKSYAVSTILSLIMCNGDTIHTTDNHPFYLQEQYIEAQNLKVGDQLFDINNENSELCEIVRTNKQQEVYNLTIKDNSNFYVGKTHILVHNDDCLLKKIQDNFPTLKIELDKLSKELKGKLMKDMASLDGAAQDALLAALNNKNGVQAWDRIRKAIPNSSSGKTTEFALDPTTLNKVGELIESSSNFRVAMGSNWEQELAEIITANKDLRCPTCSAGLTNIPPMDIMLENVEHISQFSTKPGFSSVLTALESSSPNRDGINHMISYIKANTAEFANISEFEFRYADDILNRADVLVGNVKYEFKSWTPGVPNPWNSFFSGTGNSYTQFVRYLQNTSSLDQLKYIFNGSKAGLPEVKTAFKDLLITKADDLFIDPASGGVGLAKMKAIFEKANTFIFNNPNEFKALLSNSEPFRNHVLQFIKSE